MKPTEKKDKSILSSGSERQQVEPGKLCLKRYAEEAGCAIDKQKHKDLMTTCEKGIISKVHHGFLKSIKYKDS